jgi:hypothetical protein
MSRGNKNKLQQAEELVNIEIPSTIQNFRKVTDEKLKYRLVKLFKQQFKRLNKCLHKVLGVTDLAAGYSAIKESQQYNDAIKFNTEIQNISKPTK